MKMNMMNMKINSVLENLSFTLRAMAALDTSRAHFWDDLPDSFLLATETEAAAENWAFCPSREIGKKQVREARSFFGELPFVWPVFPGAAPSYRRMLEYEGLPARGTLTAMYRALPPERETPENPDFSFTKITTGEEAVLWAETMWQGFGSSPGVLVSCVNLADGLCARRDFFLILTLRNGLPAGTALISFSKSSAGVYYFSTLPQERRKGVGAATMEEIFRVVRNGGSSEPDFSGQSSPVRDSITLQATPAGAPFYASLGFEALFDIPVHSASEDVF